MEQTHVRTLSKTRRTSTSALVYLTLCLGILGLILGRTSADPTNPVFIQRDLPPAPYAYGLQDFDSSEEVTIVKRSGQTMLPGVTYLTTPQSAEPTPLGQVVQQQVHNKQPTAAQPLPLPLPLQQKQQKPKGKVSSNVVTTGSGATAETTGVGASNTATKEDSQPVASNADSSQQQTSLVHVEMESVPRPEDLPQPPEQENSIPQKRNVYDAYATDAKAGAGCGCGGYVLVEKKIYVCEPKETIVRLMKRSHDVCAAQETQHVGVIQSPDNDDQRRFQLIPMPEGMEHQ